MYPGEKKQQLIFGYENLLTAHMWHNFHSDTCPNVPGNPPPVTLMRPQLYNNLLHHKYFSTINYSISWIWNCLLPQQSIPIQHNFVSYYPKIWQNYKGTIYDLAKKKPQNPPQNIIPMHTLWILFVLHKPQVHIENLHRRSYGHLLRT